MAALRILLVVGVVVAAATLANMALLSRAASKRDPVGRLSPVVAAVPSVARPTPPATRMPRASRRQGDDGSERDGDEDD